MAKQIRRDNQMGGANRRTFHWCGICITDCIPRFECHPHLTIEIEKGIMMRVAIMLAATIAASSAAAAPKQVAGGSQLVTAVSNCRQIQNNASRLACFDRTVDALAAADARGDVNVVDRQSMREVRRSLFGFSIPKLPFFSNSKDKEMKDEPKILETTLLSFRSLGNDFYRFSIKDPESTWDTIDAAYIGTPKPGDKVVIKKGGLGNYFVQFGREREISAKRVR